LLKNYRTPFLNSRHSFHQLQVPAHPIILHLFRLRDATTLEVTMNQNSAVIRIYLQQLLIMSIQLITQNHMNKLILETYLVTTLLADQPQEFFHIQEPIKI